jgi:hypothetical protein
MSYALKRKIDELCDYIPNPLHKKLKEMSIRFGLYQKVKFINEENNT